MQHPMGAMPACPEPFFLDSVPEARYCAENIDIHATAAKFDYHQARQRRRCFAHTDAPARHVIPA